MVVASCSNFGTSQRSQTSAFQLISLIKEIFRVLTKSNENGIRKNDEGGPNLVCENYGFSGHTIDRCFKIIGYLVNFRKKKVGPNFKGNNVSNNNFVGTSSSSAFSEEQMATLISFIKDNSINGRGVHANMAGLITDLGANQHMTYTDKFLVNVIDVTHLKIKISHPNGTEAFITKIRNMSLTQYLTLYDVLVVPEYCVSLMVMHKFDRDSKLIVAFDEMNCYVSNQDLRAGRILGTGKQISGLHYFDGNQAVMSSSTVTYTSISSDSDLTPWGFHLMDPDKFEALQSPEQALPSPDYVSGPEYPEYLALSDDEILVEDQPLPAAALPTAQSSSFDADFDPLEEDLEEDPSDYPTDEGDDEEEEESTKDDDEEEEEASEEDEHLAPTDSASLPAIDHVPSVDDMYEWGSRVVVGFWKLMVESSGAVFIGSWGAKNAAKKDLEWGDDRLQ
ncbi:hypothetical protein Tco_0246564 [Tanacetum coccineum]